MDFFAVSRPRFWMYTLGPLLLTLAVVWQEYLSTFTVPPLSEIGIALLFFLVCSWPVNMLIYGVNDLSDEDTDKHNTKKDQYENRVSNRFVLTITVVIAGFLILNTLGVTALFLRPLALIPLGLFFLTAIFYSSPPVRAKRLPILDGLFNILYILPAITLFLLLAPTQPLSLFGVIAGWLWCMAMHCYSAIPDITPDKKAGLTTTAILLGEKGSLVYCGVLRLVASLLLIDIIGRIAIVFGGVYIVMIIVSLYRDIFTVYKYFPLINTGIGFLLFWTLVFYLS